MGYCNEGISEPFLRSFPKCRMETLFDGSVILSGGDMDMVDFTQIPGVANLLKRNIQSLENKDKEIWSSMASRAQKTSL